MTAMVVIGLEGGLRREEFFLELLEGMLKLWEENRLRRNQYHVMITLKGRLKGKTGEKCHMLPLLSRRGPLYR